MPISLRTSTKQREIDFLVAQSQKRLESVQEDLSIAEILALTLKECMDLLEKVVLVWIRPKQDETARPRLAWGPNAPQDVKERQELLERIRPALPRLEQLGLAITRTVDQVLSQERRKLARDAALVADLRDDWDDGQKAALERIQREGGEPGMG
ncbi:hypothetical protein D2T29_20250 [Sinirhodobacter populi]|uniref:Uncharacterized protein n=1 Tax=Paenirhodobacter populi TaxID=2306993 RepID=A0A443K1I1_9RHOB|nr:hypothetical protein [Sinirhodobacter populi]RWR26603.1 hypothetical protein D2T29_20250 [Sinirhodobacter populi]